MSELDPILASVLQRRVVAVSREMATVLMRSSRSPIFNEVGDVVTVVFDRSGRTLAQTEFASIIAFGAAPSLQAIIEAFAGDVHEGDVFIHNDVYSGGNQFADVGLYMPVFHDGELVAWTASKGHVADIGGMTLGGYDPAFREVWQEAFRITPLRLHSRGEPVQDVCRLVRANVRLEITWEDIQSMIGACTIGRRRLLDVLERYGTETFDSHIDFVIEASERQVRAEIERWPDGVYRGESFMQSDGIDPSRRLRVACEVRIAGSEITFDFSGSDDQAPGFTNMPVASAMGAVSIAFMMLLDASGLSIPTNSGLFASLHTVFREGSLLNPRFPAASVFGNQMCDEVVESIMQALAEPLSDRVCAGWNQFLPAALSGIDPRNGGVYVDFLLFSRGGSGAIRGTDGYDALGFTGTPGSMKSQDMEIFELSTPHHVEYAELDPDSAGAGRWRGGYGTRARFRFDGEHVRGSTLGDDSAAEGAAPARGLFGAHDGSLNTLRLTFPDGATRDWGSKEAVAIPQGTFCDSIHGGGAGYGDPRQRDPELVLAEVREGLLTPSAARELYGVAAGEDGSAHDEAETARLRGAGAKAEVAR
ncbi:MAG: hydantoinase B/oxoprolinase family protein [Solirubrobacteraceae bacterium]